MEFGPSILDDEQVRDQQARLIENYRKRSPFAIRLEARLRKYWGQPARRRVPRSFFSTLNQMLRAEDAPIVLDYAFRFECPLFAFFFFSASGLFDEAEAVLEGFPERRQVYRQVFGSRIRADFSANDDRYAFNLRRAFAKHKVWGSCPAMLQFFSSLKMAQNWGPAMIFASEELSERKHAARAIHDLYNRRKFVELLKDSSNQDPISQIAPARYGGTVFIENLDGFTVAQQTELLERINTKDLDILFIIGVDLKHRAVDSLPMWSRLDDIRILGTTGPVFKTMVRAKAKVAPPSADLTRWVHLF